MERVLLIVLAVLVIATINDLAPRIHIPPALALVVLGAVVGVMPFVPAFQVDPEWILIGVLPPLLYSTAVSMPTMDFRRDFGAIGALSVLLVVISAVLLGYFFYWLIPGIDLATGIALGAIVSPTDAVATSIAKRLGVPGRVTAVLEGESMLNDASALVLLRAAVAAMAATVSFGGIAVNFVYAVVVAVLVGAGVGGLNLFVRSRIKDSHVNTAISFTVPFLAYLPAEELGASGLVAAVCAGLVTGAGAARFLTPQHRISDSQNWRTIELILEGGVFLLMGLELWSLMVDVHHDHEGVVRALWMGLAALAATIAIRAAYVTPLLWGLGRVARRRGRIRPILEGMNETIAERAGQAGPPSDGMRAHRHRLRARNRLRRPIRKVRKDHRDIGEVGPETARIYSTRIRRRIADIDYYLSAPLGPKEGAIVVWAGMRGVVTLAAAQTLPADTHSRSLLVLIAFVVAAASLLLQGGTLPWLIRRLRLADTSEDLAAERERLRRELSRTAQRAMTESDAIKRFPWMRGRLEQAQREADEQSEVDSGRRLAYRRDFEEARRLVIAAQRTKLLMLRKQGTYNSALLTRELRQLDAEEISLDMRLEGYPKLDPDDASG